MRYMYGVADEKFVPFTKKNIEKTPFQTFQFRKVETLRSGPTYDKSVVSLLHAVPVESLVDLASKKLNEMPLPDVYKWTNRDCCVWIARYGYPEYKTTFRVNMITGPKLIMLDANALQAMNIRNFAVIKHITFGVRKLLCYEMILFMRSISLPYAQLMDLYKLFRSCTGGLAHQLMQRSDVWRKMQILRPKYPKPNHWDKLVMRLFQIPPLEAPEKFGSIHRYSMYKCHNPKPADEPEADYVNCTCMPLCDCYWTKSDTLEPWTLKCLLENKLRPQREFKKDCPYCLPPPCVCRWSVRKYTGPTSLRVLQKAYPWKYN